MSIENIYDVFKNLIPFIVAAFGAIFVARQLFLIKNVKRIGNKSIYDILDQKFSSGLIKDKEDIQLIINSVSRSEDELYSISPVLEDYYTNRLSKSEDLKEEDLIQRHKLIKNIIQEENKEKPFSGVPDEERRILLNIKDAIRNDDKQAIEFNVNELNTVLTTRNKIYKSTDKLNKWSVPLAVVGVFLTILFGVLSIIPRN